MRSARVMRVPTHPIVIVQGAFNAFQSVNLTCATRRARHGAAGGFPKNGDRNESNPMRGIPFMKTAVLGVALLLLVFCATSACADKRVLLTGFMPFDQYPINPSGLLFSF